MQIVLWIPVVLAAGCILAAFVPVRRGRIRHPVYTTGVVVGRRSQKIWKNRGETESFAPIVRYETPKGEITAPSRYYLPEWQYHRRVGDQVKLCYDREEPDLMILCDESTPWRKTALLTFGVGTLLAYAVLWMRYGKIF